MNAKQAYRYMVKHSNHCIKCCEETFDETGIEAYQLNKDGIKIDIIKRGEEMWIVGESITPLEFSLSHPNSSFDYINIDYHHLIEFWKTHKLVNGEIIEI